MLNQVYTGWATLINAGVTAAFSVRSFTKHKIAYTAATISTSAFVRGEGSINGSTFFPLGSGNTLITASGTYSLDYEEPLTHIRCRLVSADGVSASIDPDYMGSE